MSNASAMGFSAQRTQGPPSGETRGPLIITVLVHAEDDTWWAESTQLPGLTIAEDSRDELVAAIRPAVDYYIEETPELQDRHFALRIHDAETLGAGQGSRTWQEARTA